MSKRKNLIIGFMAVAVIVAGIMLVPKTVAAEETVETVENGIIYVKDTTNYNITEYWSDKKVPVRKGYVFAGWYSAADENSALTEETAKTAQEAYAKFVPDYVLSVRAQNVDGTKENDGATSTRILSSVDSKEYQSVGFDIWLANKKQITLNWDGETPLTTTKIYREIMVNGEPVGPSTYFGGEASKYFSVWRLDKIADINDSKIIYVRPYWTTMDGTTVYGLAKYVHIEDQYLGYVSVPVNLMTGDSIAAGIVEMTYSAELKFVEFEAGRLLPEMAENHGIEGFIKMVGNAKTVDDVVNADGIYANLRFEKPGDTDPNTLIPEPEVADFSNWDEVDVKITPIIQY